MKSGYFEDGIKTLKGLLEEMKALLEWQKLKYLESKHQSGRLLLSYEQIQQDLTDKYCGFLGVWSQMQATLNDPKDNTNKSKKQKIVKELNKLRSQLHYLGTNVRVY